MKLKALAYALILGISSPNPVNGDGGNNIAISKGTGNVYRRSRFNGELDLMGLAARDCREDLWLFISNRWYDVGKNETFETVELNVDLVEDILSNTSGNVYEYHSHSHNWCPANDGSNISLEPISFFDVFGNVYLAERVRAHGRRLISRVVDEHGIWSYTVTEWAREGILQNNMEVINGIDSILSEDFSNLMDVPRANLSQRLDSHIMRLREKGIIVSYRRIRQ